jgi:hypothetical protein
MLKVKAKITLIALRICVPGEFGHKWARDIYQALTLCYGFFLIERQICDFEDLCRTCPGLEGVEKV